MMLRRILAGLVLLIGAAGLYRYWTLAETRQEASGAFKILLAASLLVLAVFLAGLAARERSEEGGEERDSPSRG